MEYPLKMCPGFSYGTIGFVRRPNKHLENPYPEEEGIFP
jgi:hypothetical protein